MWYTNAMAQITKEQIQAVADKIAKEFSPEKIILFGSYAWGKPTKDSDIDLCIVKDSYDTEVLERDVSMSLYPRPFPMDILVYRPEQIQKRYGLGDVFVKKIMDQGRILYGKQ